MVILNDFNTSVKKALEEINPNYMKLDGLIVCGTHTPHNIEDMIEAIKVARETNTPFLGICFGLEIALVEFARNVLKIEDANTTEIDPHTKNPIFIELPTLRVGAINILGRQESHWHKWFFNNKYADSFSKKGWQFVFKNDIMEIARYGTKTICVQFHPEYNSSINNHHPILKEFINLCKKSKE